MRRRPPAHDDDPTPIRLRRFIAEEWPGNEIEAAGHFWDACDEYRERTGLDPSTDDDSQLPDGPFNPDDI